MRAASFISPTCLPAIKEGGSDSNHQTASGETLVCPISFLPFLFKTQEMFRTISEEGEQISKKMKGDLEKGWMRSSLSDLGAEGFWFSCFPPHSPNRAARIQMWQPWKETPSEVLKLHRPVR